MVVEADCDPWAVVEASHGVVLEAVEQQRSVQRDPAEEAFLQEAHVMVQNGEVMHGSPRSAALAAAALQILHYAVLDVVVQVAVPEALHNDHLEEEDLRGPWQAVPTEAEVLRVLHPFFPVVVAFLLVAVFPYQAQVVQVAQVDEVDVVPFPCRVVEEERAAFLASPVDLTAFLSALLADQVAHREHQVDHH